MAVCEDVNAEAGPSRLGSEQPSAEASRPIQRLPEDVVNKIAAGEIIQRPANALKEMMENSLDAGAKMIRVQLRDGGIKMLQIQDDGAGVRLPDLPLLCERFATSKLRTFEDLSSMSTFGFRGEALASISYVSAAMTVTSRIRDSDVAYRTSYASGALTAPKPGQPVEPRPCAGSHGTMITAEDLFYNVPQRRRALKSASDEYALALDVVSKYAVHYGGRGVGFSCKKASANLMDLSVPSSPTLTTREAIAIIYGNNVAKNLQEVRAHRDVALSFSVSGLASGANHSARRPHFLLFINDRLVECPALRRAVLALYLTLLPKGSHPFIYLSLEIDPANVDVNVHPTKREVHFLNEDEIIEVVCTQVEKALADANLSRTYATTQSILPSSMRIPAVKSTGADRKRDHDDADATDDGMESAVAPSKPKSMPVSQRSGYPQHLVRVDGRMRTLDVMGITSSKSQSLSSLSNTRRGDLDEAGAGHSSMSRRASSDGAEDADTQRTAIAASTAPQARKSAHIAESQTSLLSVSALREKVKQQEHYETKDIFSKHVFVGIADADKTLALLQQGTKLFLVQYASVIRELSYQLLLRQFGALQPLTLEPAPYVDELVRIALGADSIDSKARRKDIKLGDDSLVCKKVEDKLLIFAEMLEEYFAIGIRRDAKGRAQLTSLPDIIPSRFAAQSSNDDSQTTTGSIPPSSSRGSQTMLQLDRVPALVLRLATQVDFSDETACFQAVLQELARAHVPRVQPYENTLSYDELAKRHEHDWRSAWSSAMRYYSPSKDLVRSDAVKAVASLPSLYSVFERC